MKKLLFILSVITLLAGCASGVKLDDVKVEDRSGTSAASQVSNVNSGMTASGLGAMQGIKHWIPTEQKVRYLNALLQCGFDVLDFGSFVSPKAIPQMQDSAAVLDQLIASPTKLLAIIANARGASSAAQHERISILGYPFSISETFQLSEQEKKVQFN
jgi:uncharacterized protein YceK